MEKGESVRNGKNGLYPSKMMKKGPAPPDCATREREAGPVGYPRGEDTHVGRLPSESQQGTREGPALKGKNMCEMARKH